MRVVMLLLFCALARPALALSGIGLLESEPINIDLNTGRGVVLIFLSAKCPCSRSHVDALKRLPVDYPDFKFVAVHANVDESLGDARAYFKANALPFPVIEDADQALAQRYGASRTPHAFILNKKGASVYRGGVSDSHDGLHAKRWPLRDALDDLNAGRAVRRTDARALGCAISRGRRAKS